MSVKQLIRFLHTDRQEKQPSALSTTLNYKNDSHIRPNELQTQHSRPYLAPPFSRTSSSVKPSLKGRCLRDERCQNACCSGGSSRGYSACGGSGSDLCVSFEWNRSPWAGLSVTLRGWDRYRIQANAGPGTTCVRIGRIDARIFPGECFGRDDGRRADGGCHGTLGWIGQERGGRY